VRKTFVILAVLMTGCQLSPSQRYGAAAIGYSTSLNVISANQQHLSDEQLLSVAEVAVPGKQLLDQAYENLTDGDPSNDAEAEIILDALETKILPSLIAVEKEATSG
jgi:hypothetical protein